jgi:hypothetical protein
MGGYSGLAMVGTPKSTTTPPVDGTDLMAMVGGLVSMQTFSPGWTTRRFVGLAWPVASFVCTVNQYQPSCVAVNLNSRSFGPQVATGRYVLPKSSDTFRMTS